MASLEPTSREVEAGAGPAAARPAPGRARRIALSAACAVLLVAAGAGLALWRLRSPAPAPAAAAPVALAAVTSGPLTSQEQEIGTVQETDSWTVVGQAQGVFTALPAPGVVVSQGRSLFAVGGQPVLLLYGSTPAYRALSMGMAGPDVAELNVDLVALGCARRAQLPLGDATFSAATAAGLQRLQTRAGLPATGQLPLGEAVFLPQAVQVETVAPSLGTEAAPGETVLQVTSTTIEVVVQLDASQESQVHVGDPAPITLPNGDTTPGTVSYVADVATAASQQNGGSGPTVEVDVAPRDPAALRSLSNAQLDVEITTASVAHALAVPVTALLAQTNGSYAVEVEGAGGAHHLVPVTLGIFDDVAGLVQVSGSGLRAGDQVAVAGS